MCRCPGQSEQGTLAYFGHSGVLWLDSGNPKTPLHEFCKFTKKHMFMPKVLDEGPSPLSTLLLLAGAPEME